MKFDKVHLLFEQSGTFRNAFRQLGFNAFDYDIKDDFGCTDFVIDLFEEIDFAFDGLPSIFDSFSSDDLIFAFFPCVRFEDQARLLFTGNSFSYKNWSFNEKLLNDLKLHDELHTLYCVCIKLFYVCSFRNLRLIFENPYSKYHYLLKYSCIPVSLTDSDRRLSGDYFCKPTFYSFINCEPDIAFYDQQISLEDTYSIEHCPSFAGSRSVCRSLISPNYVERFIHTYILG